jgi:S1-C subfamily serine protease
VVKQLKEKGRVVRGYLGVRGIYAVDDEIRKSLDIDVKNGAMIQEVEPGTPADKAGLEPYDVIVEIDGKPVKDHNDLSIKIADIQPGTTTEIKVVRKGGEVKTLKAKIAELESEEEPQPKASEDKDIGIRVRELTPRLASRYGYRTEEGLIILGVTPYSEADRKGIQRGDIILEINQERAKEVKDLERVLKKSDPDDAIMLLVRRESRRGDFTDFIVTLRIPE